MRIDVSKIYVTQRLKVWNQIKNIKLVWYIGFANLIATLKMYMKTLSMVYGLYKFTINMKFVKY